MSPIIQIHLPAGLISGDATLPSSKSESNRALMIREYSGNKVEIRNLSDAADTVVLSELLNGPKSEYDAKDAGTTFRFLTSYLAFSKKESLLIGSERMKQRPIKLLVDALRTLGCKIQYKEKEGYPPLEFKPFDWSGINEVSIDATISSQYISSLMMAAPSLPDGLTVHLQNEVASLPYLKMTWSLMQQSGIIGEFSNRSIRIPNQPYFPGNLTIESDWSAASYFYGMVALSEKPTALFLPGLKENSLQGDAIIQHVSQEWGIETRFSKEGAWIERKREIKPKKLILDCLGFPDLGQTLIVMCALSGTEAEFSGLQSLAIKETNRLLAMKTELAKIFVYIDVRESEGTCRIPGNQIPNIQNPIFETYEDHRMAMALSMIGATNSEVSIREPDVVKKSFPRFWAAMENIGFSLTHPEGN